MGTNLKYETNGYIQNVWDIQYDTYKSKIWGKRVEPYQLALSTYFILILSEKIKKKETFEYAL